MFRKCGLFALFFAQLSIVSFFVFSDSVQAQTVPQIAITDKLEIYKYQSKSSDTSYYCPAESPKHIYDSNWSDLVLKEDEAIYYSNNFEETKNSFNQAINNEHGGWWVLNNERAYVDQEEPYEKIAIVYWVDDVRNWDFEIIKSNNSNVDGGFVYFLGVTRKPNTTDKIKSVQFQVGSNRTCAQPYAFSGLYEETGLWKLVSGNKYLNTDHKEYFSILLANVPLVYPNDYDGETPPTTKDHEPGEGDGGGTEPRCSALDIACWFGNFTGAVVDGFQSLADFFGGIITALGEMIANLIMPENENGGFDNRFTNIWNNVGNAITEKLGFLSFPFTFLTDLLGAITYGGNYSTSCNYDLEFSVPSNCWIDVPNLLGETNVSIFLGSLEMRFPALWDTVVSIIRFVWIVALMGALYKKYIGVVKA